MPAITALADRGEPARTRETIYNLIGSMQFPDVLLELDAASNYSEALLGHRAQSATELVALCVNADLNLTHWGCGVNLGLGYAAMLRLSRYSSGLREPREILIRCLLYQRM